MTQKDWKRSRRVQSCVFFLIGGQLLLQLPPGEGVVQANDLNLPLPRGELSGQFFGTEHQVKFPCPSDALPDGTMVEALKG